MDKELRYAIRAQVAEELAVREGITVIQAHRLLRDRDIVARRGR